MQQAEPSEEAKLLGEALCLCGELQTYLGKVPEALQLLARGRALDPGSVACTSFFAAALGVSGKTDEALPLLDAFTNTAQMKVRGAHDCCLCVRCAP